MTRSLRLRLLLGTSLASAMILALLGFSVYGFMWHRLLAEFDSGQVTKARTIAAMVEVTDQSITFDADLEQMPEFGVHTKNPEFFEIFLSDGKVLARSPSLGGKDLPRSPQGLTLLPDGHKGRAVALQFTPHSEHGDHDGGPAQKPSIEAATVVLAARPIQVNHALDDLSWLLTILCTAAVVVCGAVLYRIVGRAVAPVNQLANEIESLKETDLSRRLDPQKVPAELSPVVEKLNGLLARLSQSFDRERAFTADVAHELRTPLAGIQTTLEVSRSRPRDAASYESTIDECREMTSHLQVMIENLLLLARADAGQLPVGRQRVDVYQLMQECWLPMLPRIEAKHLCVQNSCAGESAIDVDADKLRIVLRNLLDNAITYANDGGTIRWAVDRREKSLDIMLANTGSQISTADAGKLFDRFYRGDSSRTDTGLHCGLGLSLCRRFITLLNGQIMIDTSMGGEFIVRISLAYPHDGV